jgi:polyisoprenyl-phosphate glycosyltransferase
MVLTRKIYNMAKHKRISIVIPCYNEEMNVREAYAALRDVIIGIRGYVFELIFVDNGSTDGTRVRISQLVRKDRRVKGVYLSRNFGPEASTQAGLDTAQGDAVIIYECDMQDPPGLIPAFIRKWEQGYEIVAGVRNKIDDDPVMTFFRKVFYQIFRVVSDINVPVNSGHYGLVGRNALNAMHLLPEKYRFFRGIRAWVGFKTAYIIYTRRRRLRGKSSYNFFSYLKHAERSLFGFSYMPLDFLVYLGFFLTLLSFLFIFGYLLVFIIYKSPILESVMLLLAIVFFGGINLLALSIIGKYIQVIVEETKNRPTYIIEQIEEVLRK